MVLPHVTTTTLLVLTSILLRFTRADLENHVYLFDNPNEPNEENPHYRSLFVDRPSSVNFGNTFERGINDESRFHGGMNEDSRYSGREQGPISSMYETGAIHTFGRPTNQFSLDEKQDSFLRDTSSELKEEGKLEKLMESPLYVQYHKYKEQLRKHQLEGQKEDLYQAAPMDNHAPQEIQQNSQFQTYAEPIASAQPQPQQENQVLAAPHLPRLTALVDPLLRTMNLQSQQNQKPAKTIKTFSGLRPKKSKKKKLVYPSPRFTVTTTGEEALALDHSSKIDANEGDFILKPTAAVVLGNPRPGYESMRAFNPTRKSSSSGKSEKSEQRKEELTISEQAPNVDEMKHDKTKSNKDSSRDKPTNRKGQSHKTRMPNDREEKIHKTTGQKKDTKPVDEEEYNLDDLDENGDYKTVTPLSSEQPKEIHLFAEKVSESAKAESQLAAEAKRAKEMLNKESEGSVTEAQLAAEAKRAKEILDKKLAASGLLPTLTNKEEKTTAKLKMKGFRNDTDSDEQKTDQPLKASDGGKDGLNGQDKPKEEPEEGSKLQELVDEVTKTKDSSEQKKPLDVKLKVETNPEPPKVSMSGDEQLRAPLPATEDAKKVALKLGNGALVTANLDKPEKPKPAMKPIEISENQGRPSHAQLPDDERQVIDEQSMAISTGVPGKGAPGQVVVDSNSPIQSPIKVGIDQPLSNQLSNLVSQSSVQDVAYGQSALAKIHAQETKELQAISDKLKSQQNEIAASAASQQNDIAASTSQNVGNVVNDVAPTEDEERQQVDASATFAATESPLSQQDKIVEQQSIVGTNPTESSIQQKDEGIQQNETPTEASTESSLQQKDLTTQQGLTTPTESSMPQFVPSPSQELGSKSESVEPTEASSQQQQPQQQDLIQESEQREQVEEQHITEEENNMHPDEPMEEAANTKDNIFSFNHPANQIKEYTLNDTKSDGIKEFNNETVSAEQSKEEESMEAEQMSPSDEEQTEQKSSAQNKGVEQKVETSKPVTPKVEVSHLTAEQGELESFTDAVNDRHQEEESVYKGILSDKGSTTSNVKETSEDVGDEKEFTLSEQKKNVTKSGNKTVTADSKWFIVPNKQKEKSKTEKITEMSKKHEQTSVSSDKEISGSSATKGFRMSANKTETSDDSFPGQQRSAAKITDEENGDETSSTNQNEGTSESSNESSSSSSATNQDKGKSKGFGVPEFGGKDSDKCQECDANSNGSEINKDDGESKNQQEKGSNGPESSDNANADIGSKKGFSMSGADKKNSEKADLTTSTSPDKGSKKGFSMDGDENSSVKDVTSKSETKTEDKSAASNTAPKKGFSMIESGSNAGKEVSSIEATSNVSEVSAPEETSSDSETNVPIEDEKSTEKQGNQRGYVIPSNKGKDNKEAGNNENEQIHGSESEAIVKDEKSKMTDLKIQQKEAASLRSSEKQEEASEAKNEQEDAEGKEFVMPAKGFKSPVKEQDNSQAKNVEADKVEENQTVKESHKPIDDSAEGPGGDVDANNEEQNKDFEIDDETSDKGFATQRKPSPKGFKLTSTRNEEAKSRQNMAKESTKGFPATDSETKTFLKQEKPQRESQSDSEYKGFTTEAVKKPTGFAEAQSKHLVESQPTPFEEEPNSETREEIVSDGEPMDEREAWNKPEQEVDSNKQNEETAASKGQIYHYTVPVNNRGYKPAVTEEPYAEMQREEDKVHQDEADEERIQDTAAGRELTSMGSNTGSTTSETMIDVVEDEKKEPSKNSEDLVKQVQQDLEKEEKDEEAKLNAEKADQKAMTKEAVEYGKIGGEESPLAKEKEEEEEEEAILKAEKSETGNTRENEDKKALEKQLDDNDKEAALKKKEQENEQLKKQKEEAEKKLKAEQTEKAKLKDQMKEQEEEFEKQRKDEKEAQQKDKEEFQKKQEERREKAEKENQKKLEQQKKDSEEKLEQENKKGDTKADQERKEADKVEKQKQIQEEQVERTKKEKEQLEKEKKESEENLEKEQNKMDAEMREQKSAKEKLETEKMKNEAKMKGETKEAEQKLKKEKSEKEKIEAEKKEIKDKLEEERKKSQDTKEKNEEKLKKAEQKQKDLEIEKKELEEKVKNQEKEQQERVEKAKKEAEEKAKKEKKEVEEKAEQEKKELKKKAEQLEKEKKEEEEKTEKLKQEKNEKEEDLKKEKSEKSSKSEIEEEGKDTHAQDVDQANKMIEETRKKTDNPIDRGQQTQLTIENEAAKDMIQQADKLASDKKNETGSTPEEPKEAGNGGTPVTDESAEKKSGESSTLDRISALTTWLNKASTLLKTEHIDLKKKSKVADKKTILERFRNYAKEHSTGTETAAATPRHNFVLKKQLNYQKYPRKIRTLGTTKWGQQLLAEPTERMVKRYATIMKKFFKKKT